MKTQLTEAKMRINNQLLKIIVLCVVAFNLAALSARSATIIWNPNVEADWSFTDSLQGYDVSFPLGAGAGMYVGSGPDGIDGQVIYHSFSRFTDATSPLTPTLAGRGLDTQVIWEFDLTTYPGAPAVELTSFSMWTLRDTTFRPSFDVQIQISSDGTNWTTVASAQETDTAPNDTPYSQVIFNFDSGEATDFSYLRIVDNPVGRNVNWVEWDATIVAVPEPSAALLLSVGGLTILAIRRSRRAVSMSSREQGVLL